MKKNITKEDAIALRGELLDYAENVGQHKFQLLAIIHSKLNNSIEVFDTTDDVEKNAMFRVVYKIIGKDFSKYKNE